MARLTTVTLIAIALALQRSFQHKRTIYARKFQSPASVISLEISKITVLLALTEKPPLAPLLITAPIQDLSAMVI